MGIEDRGRKKGFANLFLIYSQVHRISNHNLNGQTHTDIQAGIRFIHKPQNNTSPLKPLMAGVIIRCNNIIGNKLQ